MYDFLFIKFSFVVIFDEGMLKLAFYLWGYNVVNEVIKLVKF